MASDATFPWWFSPCKKSMILIDSFHRYRWSKNPAIWLVDSILGHNCRTRFSPHFCRIIQNIIIIHLFRVKNRYINGSNFWQSQKNVWIDLKIFGFLTQWEFSNIWLRQFLTKTFWLYVKFQENPGPLFSKRVDWLTDLLTYLKWQFHMTLPPP